MTATNGSLPSFILERFRWIAPDRLEVSGSFSELGSAPIGVPVLRLRSDDSTYELPAIAEPDVEGGRWRATFSWQETPVWFDAAELTLGSDFVLRLPPPETPQPLPAPDGMEGMSPPRGIERVRLQAELVAAQEQAREARATLERLGEELRRARADLDAEHDRHAADADRFLESVARIRQSAEQAAAAEQAKLGRLERELEESRAELESLRGVRAAAQGLVRQLATLERALDGAE